MAFNAKEYIEVTQQYSVDTPGSSIGRFYFKGDGEPYSKNDEGTEWALSQIESLSISNLTAGDLTVEMNIFGGGSIVSNNYISDASGYMFSDTLVDIQSGTVGSGVIDIGGGTINDAFDATPEEIKYSVYDDFSGGTVENVIVFNEPISTVPTNYPKLQLSPTSEDIGDGSDGDKIVSSNEEIDTVKTYVTTTASSAQKEVVVFSSSGFSSGDKVLLHSYLLGYYEFHTIDSINANTITLEDDLANQYVNGTRGSSVTKVLQWRSLWVKTGFTLSCSAFNGNVGGIIPILVNGDVWIEGTVGANMKGFRGATTTGDVYGEGAGFGEGAGSSGPDGQVQSTYGTANLSTIFLGSGGGYDNAIGPTKEDGPGNASYGTVGTAWSGVSGPANRAGTGGGIVIIKAMNIDIDGIVNVQAGGAGSDSYNGLGAAGSILVVCNTINCSSSQSLYGKAASDIAAPFGSQITWYGGAGRIAVQENTFTGTDSDPARTDNGSLPIHPSGHFTSEVLDTSNFVNFSDIYWNENLSGSGNITVQTRSGDVQTPDGTWEAWSGALTTPTGSDITSTMQDYYQFKITFDGDEYNPPYLNKGQVGYITKTVFDGNTFTCKDSTMLGGEYIEEGQAITTGGGTADITLSKPFTSDDIRVVVTGGEAGANYAYTDSRDKTGFTITGTASKTYQWLCMGA